eukprot:TRINITY_DN1460_c0_g1_i1.p1 TRINITY_DN1460_c0_g1~~TRINITY_DN1460_c0_g1_i1.p1  ORF type:complete len:257 (+),score=55.72 TRINITY_DN1460_c0_g1_i1:104-772(+)
MVRIALFFIVMCASFFPTYGQVSGCALLDKQNGTIVLKTDGVDNCWLIQPDFGTRRQARTIELKFKSFNCTQTLSVYLSAINRFEYASYTGSLGNGTTGPPIAPIQLTTDVVLIALQGRVEQVPNSFEISYEVVEVSLRTSLNVFFALVAVLGTPCILSCWTCTPCAFDWIESEKRRRATLILVIIGSLIGFLIFGLFLGAAANRIVLPSAFGGTDKGSFKY